MKRLKEEKERAKERADWINNARQFNREGYIRNDEDTLLHIKANSVSIFKGLFPSQAVQSGEIHQIAAEVAKKYESLAVISPAILGEIFE